MKKLFFIATVLMLSACASKMKIMDAGAVSMTRGPLVPGEKIKETGPVAGRFCPDSFNDKGHIGLIDESVKAAQQQNKIDMILNASFFQQGTCVLVEGTGAQIMSKAPTENSSVNQ